MTQGITKQQWKRLQDIVSNPLIRTVDKIEMELSIDNHGIKYWIIEVHSKDSKGRADYPYLIDDNGRLLVTAEIPS